MVRDRTHTVLRLVDEWVEQGDVGAVAAAIVDADGVRELHCAGEAREESLFALASLTKPLVALAVLLAVEEGVLELDAPVGEHLAPYREGPRAAVTARQLLAHASGLPEVPHPLRCQSLNSPRQLRGGLGEGVRLSV